MVFDDLNKCRMPQGWPLQFSKTTRMGPIKIPRLDQTFEFRIGTKYRDQNCNLLFRKNMRLRKVLSFLQKRRPRTRHAPNMFSS